VEASTLELLPVLSLSASIASLVFSLGGLAAGLWAVVQVLGWKRSTHRIEYRPATETVVEQDIPKDILDQMPQKPVPQTLEQWAREQREQENYLIDEED
jgi:hypothetical protein